LAKIKAKYTELLIIGQYPGRDLKQPLSLAKAAMKLDRNDFLRLISMAPESLGALNFNYAFNQSQNNMTRSGKSSKTLHITLWVAQVILATMIGTAGFMKATQTIDQLSGMIPWTNQLHEGLVRFIGISEILGALGLVLPALLRIKPILTPLAAIGLALVQVLAIFYHLSNGEQSVIGLNILIFVIATFVALGRLKMAPVTRRNATSF
jgi:uncharacterized membrane protein YphA (DoxX/SURF4 family)